MATKTLVSVEEYLSTSYRPDCDYVDGEIRERNLGERDHSGLQTRLINLFGAWQDQMRADVLVEQRVQVKPTRFRIADICLVSRDAQLEQIIRHPPVLCVEVLSKDDTIGEIAERAQDYVEMGVPHIWILDPVRRQAYEYDRDGLKEVSGGSLDVPVLHLSLLLTELFPE